MKNPFSKVYSYKFKEFFQVINSDYTILQVVPDTSIRNYDSTNIAKAISTMYKPFLKRINIEKKHKVLLKNIKYNKPLKFSFMIDITKNDVNFYSICPAQYKSLYIEKITETWSKATVREVSSIPYFSKECLSYQVRYSKEDALSIKVDRKLNQPLNNILTVLDIMEDKTKDRVGILYNFMPCNQNGWSTIYESTMNKYNDGLPVDKNHGKAYIAKVVTLYILSAIDEVLNLLGKIIGDIFGNSKPENIGLNEAAITGLKNLIANNSIQPSKDTAHKKDDKVINTQILVMADSEDNQRKENIAKSVCESYQILDGDNKLVYEKRKNGSTVYYTDFKIKDAVVNKFSTNECKHLLELPGRELLTEHKNIDKIDVLENPVPEELQNGIVYLGKVKYKDNYYNSYLPSNYDKANLPLVLLSAQGGGKTTLIANMCKDMIKNNESVIIIDFIKNCELANAIKAITPPEKLIEINCDDINNLQGFGYNEIELKGNTDMEKLDMANLQMQQTIAFINAINVDDESRGLTSQMKRLLRAAGNITYFCGKQNVGDVIECLEDHSVRNKCIENIKASNDEVKGILRRELITLEELNERDKNGNVVGTKGGVALKGILDRVDDLQQDMRTKIMFNKSCSDNYNFVNCMNEGKVVLIKMPEDVFFSVGVKDMLTTFFCTKIILAIKLRSKQGKPKRCNVVIDELTQCEGAQSWIKQTLTQTRKFGGKYIFALHYMSQLKFHLDMELKGAGASFILLQGSDKGNYNEFKEELIPYQLEDLLNLKQFHAINLLKTNQGWTKFETELPPEPIELKKLRNINDE